MNHMIDERQGRPSASDAEANERCPGRHRMSLGMADSSTPQSIRGDVIHQYLHDPTSIELDSDDMVLANKCIQQREALLDIMWDDWRTNPPKIIQEERIWYAKNRFSGMPDFVAIRNGICLLADYKTGRIKVANAADNRQLMWLAVLIFSKYNVNEITVSVIQPYCGPATSHTYDTLALRKVRARVTLVLRRMESNQGFLRPGEKQCKYCKAKELCPALQSKARAISRVQDVTALAPAQMTEALNVIPALRQMCTAIEDRARDMIEEDPLAVPQYELVAGKTTRRIKGPQMALHALVGDGLIDESGFLQSCSVGITALRKNVQQFAEISPTETYKAINTSLANQIEEKQGKAKLCRRES